MRPRLLRRATFAALAVAGIAGAGSASAAAGTPAAAAVAAVAASTPRGASPITIVAPGTPAAASATSVTTTTTTTPLPTAASPAPGAAADVVIDSFPNAIDVGHTSTAIEQGALPIAVPDRGADTDDRISPVTLPYRGRTRLLEYRHAPDESPLLIQRYYVDQLKAQGFAVLVVCEAPCRTPTGLDDENFYWARELDPSHQLGPRAFGDRGAYLLAWRRDAVVALRIGLWDLNYGSAIKIVQSDALDVGPLERYASGHGTANAAARPGAAPTPASAAPQGVQVVPPDVAADAITHGAGAVVVQFTALDKGCASCAKASAAFDALAAGAGPGVRFLRVAYPTRAAVGADPFARAQGVASVPYFVTLQGGQVVRRQPGAADARALRARLVDGVN